MKLKPDHPQFDIALDLEVGDQVRVRDNPKKAHPIAPRLGTVIAVVREEDDPFKCVPPGFQPPWHGYGKPRERRSYLVSLPGIPTAFWPRVEWLTPIVPA